jgi:protein-S-isoprenylcysteine O-methyltransferase Ste14
VNFLELRVPPPAAVLLAAALMWLADDLLPALEVDVPAPGLFTALFAALGILFGALAIIQFRRAGTTVNPMRPDESTALVTHGVYRFSRNPMYVADVLLLAAWAAWLANLAALVPIAFFIAYMNRFQIAPEERALQARHGDAYTEYRRLVRRWL